jgi:DNA mismatch repair protein MutL
MGRIRVLSDNIANKIAAGEVVERPASVVKEMLENALDAGATNIRIEAEGGGRRMLRITDNGCGMMRDDALLAFERHATSKLWDVKDLESIATLGFRGEALPSIASVSRLILETRTQEEEAGTVVEIAGGKIVRCERAALAPGTTITVRDLFFNVPARKKFLRSEPTEIAHIASLVTHYSLAYPSKSFSLQHNATELLNAPPVATLRERVYQVFGADVLNDLVDLGDLARALAIPTEPDEAPLTRQFRLRGFVSGPQVQKLNRNSIYLFVNGRLIRDRLLLHAISAAYHNLIPPSCYPFALLFLDCASEEVDVNVHPAKTEVRFHHGSLVHDFVRDSVRERLMSERPVSRIPVLSPPQPGASLPYSEFSQRMENMRFDDPRQQFEEMSTAPVEASAMPAFALRHPHSPAPRFDFVEPAGNRTSGFTEPTLRLAIPDTHGPLLAGGLLPEPDSLEALKDLRPLGQIHDSFIVAAGRDGLWIIDQHVAHERILFEQVLEQRARNVVESQRLLLPMVVQVTAAQELEFARIAEELEGLGFEAEKFGQRTIAIKAAPAGVSGPEIEKALFEILEISERQLRKASLDESRAAIAATIACRAAIKINMKLDAAKIDWLLKSLAQTSCPMSCPHGRPIALRYGTREILRSFHRI